MTRLEAEHQYSAYQMARGTTAKTHQVVMLYEGVLTYLKQAQRAISDNDLEKRYELVENAMKVITGLQESLDFERGGEISELLYDYYQDIYYDLVHVQRANCSHTCGEVIEKIQSMLESWRVIDKESMAAEQANTTAKAASVPSDSASDEGGVGISA